MSALQQLARLAVALVSIPVLFFVGLFALGLTLVGGMAAVIAGYIGLRRMKAENPEIFAEAKAANNSNRMRPSDLRDGGIIIDHE